MKPERDRSTINDIIKPPGIHQRLNKGKVRISGEILLG